VALRVIIADDSYLVREGIAAVVRESDALELLECVADFPTLLEAVDRLQPDVVVTDIRMPPTHTTEGIQAAHEIRASHPATGVVVLSQYLQDDYAAALLSRGAAGLAYLLKERVGDPDALVRAAEAVASGGSLLDPRVVEALMSPQRPDVPRELAQLTPREREVLAAMAEGSNNGAIAAKLFLSERAVEKHITAIFMKLGLTEEAEVHRRVMAVLAYLRATVG
jgi:DNA-binding NarL/FixJ family response regulator